MLDGFGLAPVCIELDLDSYDGPWTHVHRFRGRSGWLVVAEACLSSESAEWTTSIVAACDEYGEAVPDFMAANLLGCACSLPRPCDDFPPAELDHLLEHAGNALKLRWLRDSNGGLAALAASVAERIAALEAAVSQQIVEVDHQTADLRRRMRLTARVQHREVLADAVVTLESERDRLIEQLVERRLEIRRHVADEEQTLIGRTRVAITIEPLYSIAWAAAPEPDEDSDFVRRHYGAFSPYMDTGLRAYERSGDAADLRAAIRLARECIAPPPTRGLHVEHQPAASPAHAERVAYAAEPKAPPRPVATPAPVIIVPRPSPAQADAAHARQLAALRRELAALETNGRKFIPGSRKFNRNLEQREQIGRRIAALGRPAAAVGTGRGSDDLLALELPDDLTEQRNRLTAELRAHERRGALAEDGRGRFIRYAERRKALIAEIEQLDRRVVARDPNVKVEA